MSGSGSPAATGRGDRVLRWLGGAVTALLGLVFGVYCVLLTPLRWHGWPVPLVPLLVVIGNPLLAVAAFRATGRRGAAVVPALAWALPWFVAMQPTTEGDAPLASVNAIGMSWMGLVSFLLGPIASAVAAYRILIMPGPTVRQPFT